MKFLFLLGLALVVAPIAHAQLSYDPVTAGMPVIGFANAPGAVMEGKGPFTVTVAITPSAAQNVAVDYTVSGSATNGADFQLAQGTLTIPQGQTSANLSIPLVADSDIEGDETVSIILSNPQGAAFGTAMYTFTIKDAGGLPDHDRPPTYPNLTFTGHNGSVSLALDRPWNQDASVDYILTVTPTGSGNITTLSNNTLHIPSGNTTAQIEIPTVDSTEIPSPRTFSVYLQNPINLAIYSPLYSFTD